LQLVKYGLEQFVHYTGLTEVSFAAVKLAERLRRFFTFFLDILFHGTILRAAGVTNDGLASLALSRVNHDLATL